MILLRQGLSSFSIDLNGRRLAALHALHEQAQLGGRAGPRASLHDTFTRLLPVEPEKSRAG